MSETANRVDQGSARFQRRKRGVAPRAGGGENTASPAPSDEPESQEKAAELEIAVRTPRRSIRRTHGFDVVLGARIRLLRMTARMTQTDLGQAIGVSFQQVQKYELGKDRVAVGTLVAIARALAVPLSTFFDDDMPTPTGSNVDRRVAVKAGAILQRVKDPRILKRLLDLAEVLGADIRGGMD